MKHEPSKKPIADCRCLFDGDLGCFMTKFVTKRVCEGGGLHTRAVDSA